MSLELSGSSKSDDDKNDAPPPVVVESTEESVATEESVLQYGPQLFRMKPALEDTFQCLAIKKLIQQTLTKTLRGKKYNADDARKWTKEITSSVNMQMKEMGLPRYKHIVQTAMAQQTGAGVSYIAKCNWDSDCDNQATAVFTNPTMFCVCTVFGIYMY